MKLEGVKFRFPLMWFKCTIARSYAVCTDLRTLGFFPSIKRSLSTVSSIPIGSSLFRGSHCLKYQEAQFSEWQRRLSITTCERVKNQQEARLSCLNLTKFFWCQRRALRRAFPQLPFVSIRPVWAPPQEAREWGCHCEEALPGACLGQQSVTIDYVSYSKLNNYSFSFFLYVNSCSWRHKLKRGYSVHTMSRKIKYILTIAGYDGYPLHLAQTRSRGASSVSLSKHRSVDFPVNRIFQHIQLMCICDSPGAQTENLLPLY